MKKPNLANIVTGLLISCSLFLLAGPAMAERGHRGHGGFTPEKMLEKMTEHLGLSTEQQSQVKTILDSHQPKFEQLREQMKSTFTEDQRQAMKEMRKNRKRGEGGERPGMEERRAKMAELGVTEEQMSQMRSLREQMKAQREQVQNEISAVLTPEQKAKAEEMKQKFRNRRGHRGMRGEGGAESR